MTRVLDVMTRGVRSLSPQDTLQQAAQAMDELNIGSIPICNGEKLVGMVTDRDITIRGVATGKPADRTALDEVMTPQVTWCYEDQALQEALDQMQDDQIRRVPVVDRAHRLVGILSLGDVAAKTGSTDSDVAETLAQISEPSEPDRMADAQRRLV